MKESATQDSRTIHLHNMNDLVIPYEHPRPSSLAGELPEDILRCIFIMTLPVDRPEDSVVSRAQTVAFPLHLSHVNRLWRQTALSLRELWSFPSIFLDSSDRGKLEVDVEVFDVFLSRTSGRPLNFQVQCVLRGEEDSTARNHVEHIIVALLKQQHRWRNMVLRFEGLRLSSPSLDFQVKDAPLLRNLELHISLEVYDGKTWKPHRASVNIDQSTRVESLTLSGDYDLLVGEAPKYELSECTLIPSVEPSANWCANKSRDILTRAPYLQKLDLRNKFPREPYPSAQHNLFVHSLKKLRIQYGYATEQILESLHLPNLKELYYSDSLMPWHALASKTLEFLQRTQPTLTSLTIHGRFIPSDNVLGMLRLQPALIALDIRLGFYQTNGLFQALTLNNRRGGSNTSSINNTSVLCPSLRTLRICTGSLQGKERGKLNKLFPMIRSRFQSTGTFNFVLVEDWKHQTEVSTLTRNGFGAVQPSVKSADCILIETIEDPGVHPGR